MRGPTIPPTQLIGPDRVPDYICWQVAKGVASEHDRLFYEVDYVRVWMQYSYSQATYLSEKSRPR